MGPSALPHRRPRRADRGARLHGRRQGRSAGADSRDAGAARRAQEVHPRHRQGLPEGVSDRRWRRSTRARCRSCSAAITASPPDRWPRRPTGRGARRNLPIGLLWVDAHGDMNTPATSLSGNVHGMPLAALLGPEPAELVEDRHLLAEGAARAHRARRHPQPRRAREGRGPRLGRARLHDEGHRSPGHRVDRRAGGEPRRQRHRRHPRVVRHRRLRSADRARRRHAGQGRARTTARRTW